MLCRTALHKLKASSSSTAASAAAGDGDSTTSKTYLPVLPHSYKRTFDHDHLMKRRKRLIQFLEVVLRDETMRTSRELFQFLTPTAGAGNTIGSNNTGNSGADASYSDANSVYTQSPATSKERGQAGFAVTNRNGQVLTPTSTSRLSRRSSTTSPTVSEQHTAHNRRLSANAAAVAALADYDSGGEGVCASGDEQSDRVTQSNWRANSTAASPTRRSDPSLQHGGHNGNSSSSTPGNTAHGSVHKTAQRDTLQSLMLVRQQHSNSHSKHARTFTNSCCANSYIARKAASGAFSAARSLASGASLVASGASKGAKQLKAQMPSATHLKKSMPAAPKLSQLYSYPATRREKSSNSTSNGNSPGASPSHR
eukprot:10676-Heterococcus_DN1.PRE.1